ncbi:hypothetical protein TNCV_3917811 [Trichonephila clavipes]|nr:hypothetical protein TNCV_3917811 [Trichonephila clavipes]
MKIAESHQMTPILLPKERDGAQHQTCLVNHRYGSFQADHVRKLDVFHLLQLMVHLQLVWSRESMPLRTYAMFSHESRFSLQSDFCRSFIRRAPGTHYHKENTLWRSIACLAGYRPHMECPAAFSPYLNPVQHVWDMLGTMSCSPSTTCYMSTGTSDSIA